MSVPDIKNLGFTHTIRNSQQTRDIHYVINMISDYVINMISDYVINMISYF